MYHPYFSSLALSSARLNGLRSFGVGNGVTDQGWKEFQLGVGPFCCGENMICGQGARMQAKSTPANLF